MRKISPHAQAPRAALLAALLLGLLATQLSAEDARASGTVAPSAPPALAPDSAHAANPVPAIAPGLYSGSVQTGPDSSSPMALRILEGGGGLLDLPDESVYGYPLEALRIEGTRLSFAVGGGESGDLLFSGELVASGTGANQGGAGQGPRIEGRFSRGEVGGSFSLALSAEDAGAGSPLSVPVRGGRLSGSLLLPEGSGPWPLVLIVSGAGTTDRDGNNYNVPGRSDSLKSLALALRGLGLASYRYDKRGSGASYLLAGPEKDSRFDDYIEDARAVFEALRADSRFSRIVLAGHTEGALVAAAAANAELAAGKAAPDGLVLLCASGKSAVESVSEALASAPEDKKAEAAAIMAALEAGKTYAEPSAYFADFFRPSFQPYLASWFRYDLKKELASWKGGLLLVQGDRDFQVTMAEFAALAQVRPEAPALVVPAMSHALKEVPPDLDENYKAFSDPSFPLAPGLAEALADFVEGKAYPPELKRFDGGTLQAAP